VNDHAVEMAGPGIVIDAISKHFGRDGDRVDVLQNIDLTVAEGEFVTVVGPSGCGKSTLLRVVAGLLRANRGTVTIAGESPDRASSAKNIGLVPQAPALLPWRTVLDNVRLPLQINKNAPSRAGRTRDPVELLNSFGLGHVVDRYPSQISGGMQQRVAIARAYVFDPSVLLMDEPFAALDELNREAQRHKLVEFWERNQKTILFVTHSVPEAVMMSDRIVVMSSQPGRVTRVIDVDLPRPRSQSIEATPAFISLTETVRLELRQTFRGLDD
jgi:NitT/TauT family transport system ATP-binding protein